MQNNSEQINGVVFGTILSIANHHYNWLANIEVVELHHMIGTVISAVIGAVAAFYTTKLLKYYHKIKNKNNE
jgi:hypothetical protein